MAQQTENIQSAQYDIQHDADVLVIGGGPAGAWAALAAREAGARVILADKGYMGTSGVHASAGGSIYYIVPDNPEQRSEQVAAHLPIAFGLADTAYIEQAYDQVFRNLSKMARWGYAFPRSADGHELRNGLNSPTTMYFLRQQLLRQGVVILDHHPVLNLVVSDGVVAGAAGVHPRTGEDWLVRAGAVVLATGGCNFLSGGMGMKGQTGEGYLMAAEAGAGFSGMEFSSQYAPSPKGSAVTKTGMYEYGWSMWDGNGKPIRPGRQLAEALIGTGKAWCILDKYDEEGKRNLRLRQTNTFAYFDRVGIDPFTQPFEVGMRLEGTIRASGGLSVGDEAATGVPGLYAAGDVTSRERLVGAAMSGAGPALAWTFASGSWSGRAAARFARESGDIAGRKLSVLGAAGLRANARTDATTAEVEDVVREEMLPLEKNFFRSEAGLNASLDRLGKTWETVKTGTGRWRKGDRSRAAAEDRLRTRQAAAMIAGGRLIYSAALARTETRGIHRRSDFTAPDAAQADHIGVSGLDAISLTRRPHTSSHLTATVLSEARAS